MTRERIDELRKAAGDSLDFYRKQHGVSPQTLLIAQANILLCEILLELKEQGLRQSA